METTKYITENYRKSVMDDELATKILADLYINLPKSEKDLCKGYPNNKIKLKLSELFRASLIEKTNDDLLRISPLGKLILLKLNIAEFIVDYQLNNLNINTTDKYFLNTCIKNQACVNENYYNNVSSYIKTLTNLIESENFSKAKKKNLLKYSLYTYIVGLDENLNKIGVNNYPEFVISNLKNIDLDHWNNVEGSLSRQRKNIGIDCEYSKHFIQKSNQFFIEPSRSVYKWSDECSKIVTYIRIVNPMINMEIDRDLFIFYKFNDTLLDKIKNSKSFDEATFNFKKILNSNTKKEEYIGQFKEIKELISSTPNKINSPQNLLTHSLNNLKGYFEPEYLDNLSTTELFKIEKVLNIINIKVKHYFENKKITKPNNV